MKGASRASLDRLLTGPDAYHVPHALCSLHDPVSCDCVSPRIVAHSCLTRQIPAMALNGATCAWQIGYSSALDGEMPGMRLWADWLRIRVVRRFCSMPLMLYSGSAIETRRSSNVPRTKVPPSM